ncbi:MAG: OsmC family peroxiredoxin [Zetaproteobacteria bacterium]|nr:MAG: OsmC family peroxiredoxin [Zetaproteobacteria bacterium]
MGERFRIESTIGNHALVVDQPRTAGGEDAGPTPLEYFFLSLAGCIATIARIAAKQKRIALRSMDVTVEGDLDVEGLLGRNPEAPVGFSGITATVKMDADMSQQEKEAFVREVDRRCPVSVNIHDPTPVRLVVE